MAALTTCAISARTPRSVTVTLNASQFDLTGVQVIQLGKVFDALRVECAASLPTDASVVVSGI
jgi:hypothetical protein